MSEKPRMCEVLGVEVGEKFRVVGGTYRYYYVNEDGQLCNPYGHVQCETAVMLINHPEYISRGPMFTNNELAVLRLMKRAGVKYVSNVDGFSISVNPIICGCGAAPKWLLPSMEKGQRINLDEMELDE